MEGQHSMTASQQGVSIVARIRRQYEELPPSERKLADLILDFPGDIAGYSATELAELSGVSKAAATRLVQRLGYSSYENARRSARDAQNWGSPLYLLSQEPETGAMDAALKTHMERDLANMARTFEGIDTGELDQIVEAMIGARRLWLLGFRNSHFLATYARWQFMQVRDFVHLLPQGGETLAEYVAGLTKEDLLICVGFRRRLGPFRRVMQVASGEGIPILYITDPTVGPTAQYATWTLRSEVAGVGVFDSYTSALALINFLSVSMVRKAGPEGRARLKRIEDLHEDLHEFD